MVTQIAEPRLLRRQTKLVAVVVVAVILNVIVFGVVVRRNRVSIGGPAPALTMDPSGEYDWLRMRHMVKTDKKLGMRDAEVFGVSNDAIVNDYITEHNARARKISSLKFSGGSDYTAFYGGDVLPAHGEFVREQFRFTWKVGPWHRFHKNGETGWSDAGGGGKFSVDNLNLQFVRLFDPGAFTISKINDTIEVKVCDGRRLVRQVDVLKSDGEILMFDRAERILARSVHPDPEGRRRTYVIDFLGSVSAWKSVGLWIPDTIAVTFVPRNESGGEIFRSATYIDSDSVTVNGQLASSGAQ